LCFTSWSTPQHALLLLLPLVLPAILNSSTSTKQVHLSLRAPAAVNADTRRPTADLTHGQPKTAVNTDHNPKTAAPQQVLLTASCRNYCWAA
jgi:hypothetical protein